MNKKFGISGSTLKLIAVVSMLIDHIGAAVVIRLLYACMNQADWIGESVYRLYDNKSLFSIYFVMRSIGRIAFPIYCFLLVEGFEKTRNRWKYALRLFLFALISEVPFDLAFQSKVYGFNYQNVFFTLFLGLLAMICMDAIQKKLDEKAERSKPTASRIIWAVGAVLTVAIFAYLADLLKTDYSHLGVMCISVLYLLRRNRLIQTIAGAVSFSWEMPAPLAFLPIYFYNGKRGWKLKYFFYAFYPVHLLLLYLVCRYLGIHIYSAI